MVPPPTDGLLPAHDAGVWAQAVTDALVAEEIPAFAAAGHPGEWTLRLSASLDGSQVTPHYRLLDWKGGDRGEVVGHAVAAAIWSQGTPDALKQAADEAAPQLLALLRSVDASMKQSDPNSLYNRPARIYFAGVTGAPGDGRVTLEAGMRQRIPETGDRLVDRANQADFLMRGTVKLTAEPGGQQQVEIHWLVADPAGHIIGDVAQGHDVPKGTLDHHWGDIAAVVTDEAADGVHEVITNFSGRRKDTGKKPGS